MKKVIYTCITGGYDTLKDPLIIEEGWDYVCFTDSQTLTSTTWQFRVIPDELTHLDKTRQQRIIKVRPHIYLPEYDLSVWVDGNITINFQVDKLVNSITDDEHSVYLKQHPSRHCIYKELIACTKLHKDDPDLMAKQVERYKLEGFPNDYGLSENNVIIRKHKDELCIKLMDTWADEIINGSKRDQLSLFYCIWKVGTKYKMFPNYDFLRTKGHKKI